MADFPSKTAERLPNLLTRSKGGSKNLQVKAGFSLLFKFNSQKHCPVIELPVTGAPSWVEIWVRIGRSE